MIDSRNPGSVLLASLFVVSLAGCADKADGEDELGDDTSGDGDATSDDTSGDGDGDDTTGDGDGDGDTTGDGDGDGDGDDPMCMGGEVSDSISVTGPAEGTFTYDCSVTALDILETDPPQYVASLSCTGDGGAFDAEINFVPSTALAGAFPLAPDDSITLATFFDDFPPNWSSYLVHDAESGLLRLGWIEGFDLDPAGAADGWSSPLSIADGVGSCEPDENNTAKQSLDVDAEAADTLHVFSQNSGVITTGVGDYEVRVTRATYNPDIDGGCNSCYAYAILAPG